MVLVPRSTFKAYNLTQPEASSLTALDNKMREILHDETLTSAQKLSRYLLALHESLIYSDKIERHIPKVQLSVATTKSKKTHPEPESIGANFTPLEDSILKETPPLQRDKVLKLLKEIGSSSSIGWQDTGELVVDGEVMKNTKLEDIVQDMSTPGERPKAITHGELRFLQSLSKDGIDPNLIGNKSRRRQLTKMTGLKTPIRRSSRRPKPYDVALKKLKPYDA